MKHIYAIVVLSLLGIFAMSTANSLRVEAQVQTAPFGYWKQTHITTATTTLVKAYPGGVGCVVIGVAGAASSTVKLYDGAVTGANLKATIDGAATAGQPFCYNAIYNTSINVVTASGGVVPDTVVMWH